MSVLFYTHDSAFDHLTPEGHAEQPARMTALREALADLPLERHQAPRADAAEVLRCHPQSHLDRIRAAIPASGTVQLDEDTHVSPGSLDAALHAIGGAEAAVDAVLARPGCAAFVAMRPPGHHAETDRVMGFCLFGTAAIAAKYALDHHGLARVAVLDFDVHHGNGTQDLLWNEPRALFVSSQQMPLWPGTGAASETGAHDNMINLPLAPESDGAAGLAAWRSVWPRLRDFAPQLVILSAGFDAHRDDPLAQLAWDEADFAQLTAEICEIAAEARAPVVSLLEGGYDLDALGRAARAHVIELQKAAT